MSFLNNVSKFTGVRAGWKKDCVIELQVMATNWALQRLCVRVLSESVRLLGCKLDEAVRVKCRAPVCSRVVCFRGSPVPVEEH